MSQNTENFEQLRRLLKLKRYEQPPPRYFNEFSQQVIARIRAGERAEENSLVERLLWEAPWLQRVWAAFEAKPMLAGVFGVAMCGLLVTGVIYSDKTDVQSVVLIPVSESTPNTLEVANMMAANHPLLAKPSALETSSTNPISALPSDSPFFHAQPASFTFPGRN